MSRQLLSGGIAFGIERCPQCGVSNPLLEKVGQAHRHYAKKGYDATEYWYFTCRCSKCRNHVLFYGYRKDESKSEALDKIELTITRSFPGLERAADELPPMAAKFYQQAIESKHAPDGALMLAASSIDAMLKDKGYQEGALYGRIKKANSDGLLTAEMAAWAHEIRLSANEPRHADETFSGATPEDAEQVLAFAKSLGEYLYVLPARVKRWKDQARQAEQV